MIRSLGTSYKSGLVILGAGGIGIVAADIARCQGLDVVGFLDDSPEKRGTVFCGAPVLGDFNMLSDLRRVVPQVVVAYSNCRGRLDVAHRALSYGFSLPNLIHPSAVISQRATLERGSIIMPGVIVNAGAHIGSNTILNTAASVDHECRIGDGVHIAPGARLAGLVAVGNTTWIGIGSVVRESIQIGDNVLLGAGSLVLRDIPDGVIAYGSPATVIRANVVSCQTKQVANRSSYLRLVRRKSVGDRRR
jgi:sugar O-acyltransferase (sialic acid O-acetyltransferase NeuD family)